MMLLKMSYLISDESPMVAEPFDCIAEEIDEVSVMQRTI
jgi:hypothetical protein